MKSVHVTGPDTVSWVEVAEPEVVGIENQDIGAIVFSGMQRRDGTANDCQQRSKQEWSHHKFRLDKMLGRDRYVKMR